MSALSDALAALDKATPVGWFATKRIDAATHTEAAVFGSDGDMVCMVYPGYEDCVWIEAIDRAKIIAAAPDALAWIKEAVEWLYEYRPYLEEKAEAWKGRTRGDNYVAELASLDALIARAKPMEVGR